MDRPLDPDFRSTQLRRRVLVALIAIAAAAGVIVLSRAALTPSVDGAQIRTATVERGAVASGLEASGTVVPAVEKVIASPIEARVERVVHQAGAAVRPGDEIVRLDLSQPRLDLERFEQQLAQKRNARARIGHDLDEEVAELAGKMEQKKLDAEIFRYRADQNRTLRSEGLVSDETLRESEVEARKAEIELEQLKRKVEAARRSAAMDLAALDLDIEVLRKEVEQSREQLGRASARSDREGIVTWVIAQEGAIIRRGDPLARVADLGSLRVAGTISDVHADSVRPGLPVRIRAGEARLEGRISAVDPTVDGGVVRFTVELEGGDTTALRNNQRVDLDIFTGAVAEALRIPRGDYGVADGSDVVFRIEDGAAVRTPVRFGRTDADGIEVIEGLNEGDEVIVSDMDGLWHAETVKVKDNGGT